VTTTSAKNDASSKANSCCAPDCCGGGESKSKPTNDIREVIKERYGQAVQAVLNGAKPSCCGAK
jgi:hypothetical protein